MMKRFGMLVLGLCFLGAGAMAAKTEMEMPGPAAFDPRIDEPGEFWKTTNETFVTPKDRPFFRWNKSGPDGEAHHPAYADGPKLSFLGLRVYEANVGFTGGLVKDVKLSFYNRGDVGNWDQKALDELVRKIDAAIQARTGKETKPITMPRQTMRDMTIQSRRWIKPPYRFTLQWSMIRDQQGTRAEFVQLEIEQATSAKDGRNTPTVSLKTGSNGKAMDLKKNLAKEADGTVWIQNIPMVDQGAKGYCAVATTERVMRYYGSEVSEHMLAGVANSSASGGTDPRAMLDALKKAGGKLGVSVKTLVDMDTIERTLPLYNRGAKRAKKPEVSMAGITNISDLYEKLDPQLFLDTRCKEMKGDFARFQKEVMQKVDAGIPLLWGVHLGLFPEEGLPQAGGGHMRLIIGYNVKTKELVYSDSWGEKHAKKSMQVDQAWTMTNMLSILEPRKSL